MSKNIKVIRMKDIKLLTQELTKLCSEKFEPGSDYPARRERENSRLIKQKFKELWIAINENLKLFLDLTLKIEGLHFGFYKYVIDVNDIDKLKELLDSKDTLIRNLAIKLLRFNNTKESLLLLISWLNDENEAIKLSAKESIDEHMWGNENVNVVARTRPEGWSRKAIVDYWIEMKDVHPEVVETFRRLLKNKSPYLRNYAAYRLSKNLHDESSLELLIEALRDEDTYSKCLVITPYNNQFESDYYVKSALISAIGYFGGESVIDLIMAEAYKGTVSPSTLISTLREIKSKKSLSFLHLLLKIYQIEYAINHLKKEGSENHIIEVRIEASLSEEEKKRRIEQIIEKHFDEKAISEQDKKQRVNHLIEEYVEANGLSEEESKQFSSYLFDMFNKEKINFKQFATLPPESKMNSVIESIGSHRQESSKSLLFDLLEAIQFSIKTRRSNLHSVKQAILVALANIGGDDVDNYISNLLLEDPERISANIIYASRSEKIIELLVEFLEKEEHLKSVVELLSNIPESIPYLKKIVNHDKPYVKMLIIQILGNMRRKELESIFLEAKKDPYAPIRLEAIKALDQLKKM